MSRITSFRESGRRYATLRVIGFLCSLIGVILLLIGGGLLIFGVYALATGGTATPPMAPPPFPGAQAANIPSPLVGGFSLLWSLGILLSGLQLVALGAFLKLMIHLEENTRASAQMLDSLRSRLESSPAGNEVRLGS
jgi:hypothetical protein